MLHSKAKARKMLAMFSHMRRPESFLEKRLKRAASFKK